MLKQLIDAYKQNGVEFASLETAESDGIYTLNPQVTFDSGAELIYQVMKERGLKPKDLGLHYAMEFPGPKLEAICR